MFFFSASNITFAISHDFKSKLFFFSLISLVSSPSSFYSVRISNFVFYRTKRTFTVTQPQNEELVSLVVTQFHFTSWPDRGVPDNPVVFLSFIHAVMGAQNDAQLVSRNESEEHLPPMIIHCSAGVGRSGVFILVYSMLTYLPYVSKGGRHILNIFETIQRMRKYRRYFVQTLDQVSLYYFLFSICFTTFACV